MQSVFIESCWTAVAAYLPPAMRLANRRLRRAACHEHDIKRLIAGLRHLRAHSWQLSLDVWGAGRLERVAIFAAVQHVTG